jgi:hypothetical protein
MSERLFGSRMRPPQVREALGRFIFERPKNHATRFNIVSDILQRQNARYGKPVGA